MTLRYLHHLLVNLNQLKENQKFLTGILCLRIKNKHELLKPQNISYNTYYKRLKANYLSGIFMLLRS